MKKIIEIRMVLDQETNQIATLKNVVGFSADSISNQFELLGILENLVDTQKEKIKTLKKIRKNGSA